MMEMEVNNMQKAQKATPSANRMIIHRQVRKRNLPQRPTSPAHHYEIQYLFPGD